MLNVNMTAACFYRIAPAMLRQASYGTIKIGTYQSLKRMFVEHPEGEWLFSIKLRTDLLEADCFHLNKSTEQTFLIPVTTKLVSKGNLSKQVLWLL